MQLCKIYFLKRFIVTLDILLYNMYNKIHKDNAKRIILKVIVYKEMAFKIHKIQVIMNEGGANK